MGRVRAVAIVVFTVRGRPAQVALSDFLAEFNVRTPAEHLTTAFMLRNLEQFDTVTHKLAHAFLALNSRLSPLSYLSHRGLPLTWSARVAA
jgi:hypothetical protein